MERVNKEALIVQSPKSVIVPTDLGLWTLSLGLQLFLSIVCGREDVGLWTMGSFG
jgi:hypothetical protein